MPKQRLDQLVVEQGLCESREMAQRMIRAGQVSVNGHPASKPGHSIAIDSDIQVKERPRFVSRGGEKLLAALDHFPVTVEGRTCLDVGASTGGFTDCLLQHGAEFVYAIDVGRGQLHDRIQRDPRVESRERVNARALSADDFPSPPSLCVIDVSFISLTKILPAVKEVLNKPAELITLIKPQFEAGRDQVERGGVVRDSTVHEQVIQTVKTFGTEQCGLTWEGIIPSPLKGPAGNVEFLAHWKYT